MTPHCTPTGSTLYCLHFLGGSAGSWIKVVQAFGSDVRCVPLDLPGFGDAADLPGAGVAAMAAAVAERVRADAPSSWGIAGHSMGAKVALALARDAEDGDDRLAGLAGLALLAGSPPSPEPMEDEKRADLIAWIDGADALRQEKARAYIRENVGAPLDRDAETEAVADVLRANPAAWKTWLSQGSKEDWRERIGVLRTPALVVSGARNKALGPAAQQNLMLPHFADARHIVIEGAGHLLPLERPQEVARILRDLMGRAMPGHA